MPPPKIYAPEGQNNPKALARPPQIIDDQALPGEPRDSGKGKTYVIRYVYNDGTVEDEYRRYSGQGIENDPVIKQVPKADDDGQVARWKEQQKASTTQATAAAKDKVSENLEINPATGRPGYHIVYKDGTDEWSEKGVPASATGSAAPPQEKDQNGRHYVWRPNPDGKGGEWVDVGPAAAGPSGSLREPVAGYPGITKVTSAKKDAQGNEAKEVYYEDEQGNRVPTPGAQGAKGSNRQPVPKHPGIYEVTNATKDAQGNETKETHYEDEAGNRVPTPVDEKEPARLQDPETKQWLEKQPDGTWAPIKVQGATAPGQGPSLDELQLEYGQVTDGFKAYATKVQEAIRNGTLTPADGAKKIEDAAKAANLKITEMNNLLTTQRGFYSDQSANWRQEQATANTRLNAASSAHSAGMTAMNNLKGASGEGAWGQVFGSMAAARLGGDMFGGYASGAPPALPPSAMAIMQMMPDGTITLNPKAMTAGAAGLPASAQPVAQSAEEAVAADTAAAGGRGTTLPGQPGPDFTPAPGMDFSGGQLRAPGFSEGMLPPSAALEMIDPEIRGMFDDETLLAAMPGLA